MFLRFVHVVACTNSSFLSMTEQYSMDTDTPPYLSPSTSWGYSDRSSCRRHLTFLSISYMPLKKPRATRNTNVNKTKIFLKEGFDSSLPKAFLWGSKCCLCLAEHVFPFLITNISFISKQSKISSHLPHPLFISLLVQNSEMLLIRATLECLGH